MLGIVLRSEGFQPSFVADGERALSAFRDARPDIVLLDLMLPGMSGFEVATKLRALPEFTKTTLVAFSGYGQETDRQLSSDAGFDHHLVKPATVDQIEAILAKVASPAAAGRSRS